MASFYCKSHSLISIQSHFRGNYAFSVDAICLNRHVSSVKVRIENQKTNLRDIQTQSMGKHSGNTRFLRPHSVMFNVDRFNVGVCSGIYHGNVVTVIVTSRCSLRFRSHPLGLLLLVPSLRFLTLFSAIVICLCWSLLCVFLRCLSQSSSDTAKEKFATLISYHNMKTRNIIIFALFHCHAQLPFYQSLEVRSGMIHD